MLFMCLSGFPLGASVSSRGPNSCRGLTEKQTLINNDSVCTIHVCECEFNPQQQRPEQTWLVKTLKY